MTMAYIAIGVAVISATMAGVSSAQAADAQQKQFDYQAQVNKNNALTASRQRSIALQNSEIEAQNKMRETAALLSDQRATMSANGIDITQGSALDILATTRMLGKQDVATIQSNAAKQAWGYAVEASNYTNEAAFAENNTNNIDPAASGGMAAGMSLLSSASSYSKAGGTFGSGKSAKMTVRPNSGGGWG